MCWSKLPQLTMGRMKATGKSCFVYTNLPTEHQNVIRSEAHGAPAQTQFRKKQAAAGGWREAVACRGHPASKEGACTPEGLWPRTTHAGAGTHLRALQAINGPGWSRDAEGKGSRDH